MENDAQFTVICNNEHVQSICSIDMSEYGDISTVVFGI